MTSNVAGVTRPRGGPVAASVVVRRLIVEEFEGLLRSDLYFRQRDSVEGVHQIRVAARRLRSELGVVRDALRSPPRRHLTSELAWLGRVMGRQRDFDVLAALFVALRREVPDDATVFDSFDESHDRCRGKARAVLDAPRYRRLIRDLASASVEPPVRPRARASARTLFQPRLRATTDLLFDYAGGLGPHPRVEELHQLRILTKRARYNFGVAAGYLDVRCQNVAAGLADAQAVLGDIHDRVVAIATLQEMTRGTECLPQISSYIERLQNEIIENTTRWHEPLFTVHELAVHLSGMDRRKKHRSS